MSDKGRRRTLQTGDGGIAVGGKVEGNVTVNNYPAPRDLGPDEAALQRGYLQWLMAQCRPLSLAAIDYGAEDPGAPRLGLEQVYTALLTSRRGQDPEGGAAKTMHLGPLSGFEEGAGFPALGLRRPLSPRRPPRRPRQRQEHLRQLPRPVPGGRTLG